MEDDQQPKNDARVLKATHLLQAKVGGGTIDEKKIERSQKVIDKNKIDFRPLAREFLDILAGEIEEIRGAGIATFRNVPDKLSQPVMEIKANAAMFGYALVGRLATTVLHFLETVKKLDEDVLDIVEAHHKTLSLLIDNKVAGEGGEYGEKLETELNDALKRYFTKNREKMPESTDDAFFLDF